MRASRVAWAGLLALVAGACSDDRPPLSGDAARAEGGPGREGGAGDGGTGRDSRPGPDLPPAPTRWVTVPGQVQPLVSGHAVALLENGDVLVAAGSKAQSTGGSGWETVYVAEAYRYVALADRFEPAGKVQVARTWPTATRLKDGRVLIIGGDSDIAYGHTEVDIYDPSKPAATAWSKGAPLPKGRYGHTAALLHDGTVLVAGGCYSGQSTESYLLYDPAKDSWATLGPTMKVQRCFHTMTTLPSGKLLITGGVLGPYKSFTIDWTDYHDTMELFDPKTGAGTLLATKMSNKRANHSADQLRDGRLLLAGGRCGTCAPGVFKNLADIYDPELDKITPIANYDDYGTNSAAHTVMADGRVLMAGSAWHPERAIAYTTSGIGAWVLLPDLNKPRYSAEAVTLLDGTILLVGGRADDPDGGMPIYKEAERFVP